MLFPDGRNDVMSLCVSSFDLLAVALKPADATVISATTTLTTKKTMA